MILLTDRRAPHRAAPRRAGSGQRLGDELGRSAAESTVRGYVREPKQELAIGVQVFVPRPHPPGARGEVDFYEAHFCFPSGATKAKVIAVCSEFLEEGCGTR